MQSSSDSIVRFRILFGGVFYKGKGNEIRYRKGPTGQTKWINDVDPDLMSKVVMEDLFKEKIGLSNIKELWYLKPGETISKGLEKIENDDVILEMFTTVGKDKCLHIYVIEGDEPSPSLLSNEDTIPISSLKSCHTRSSDSVPVQASSSNFEDQVLGMESSDSDEDFKYRDSEDEDDDLFDMHVNTYVKDGIIRITNVEDLAKESPLESTCVEKVINNACNHHSNASNVSVSEIGADAHENIVEHDANLEEFGSHDEQDQIFEVDVNDYIQFHGIGESDYESIKQRSFPSFNSEVDFKTQIILKEGMLFESADIFRKALVQLSIQTGGSFYFLKNDRARIAIVCDRKCDCPMRHARKACVCGVRKCPFFVNASRYSSDGSFQLKSFMQFHECGRMNTNPKVTSLWLAEKYVQRYKDDPSWKLKAFMSDILREFKVDVTYTKAWRARLRAMLLIHGDSKEEYGKVWDYAHMVISKNPGSSAYVKVAEANSPTPVFERFYVCLNACKQGYLNGCRPIIGLDGCHLRGAFSGQILVAVGKDGNNNIFPIAYAVVEAERKDTWEWFLNALLGDVGQRHTTFMSDRQKVK